MAEKNGRHQRSLVQLTIIKTVGTVIRGIFIACAINYFPYRFPTASRLTTVFFVVGGVALLWEGLRVVHNRLFGITHCD